ncbi:MAG TPA: winged helix-turn-helix domain-containing protein [Pyrinomonadaceae bacterium]|jgi:DNA-binding winged helix-turn-helix (wHTH) protein/Tfp pilus assembly protein PilF
MDEHVSPVYEFGPFRLDAQRHILLRGDEHVALAPKVLETLLVLVRSAGRVLNKSELIAEVWPDTFVEESNLAQHIFVLRKVLGEEKNEHRFIVTVPGAGYRFVAPVKVSGATPKAAQTDETPDSWPPASLAVLPFKTIPAAAGDEVLGLGLADALIMKLSGLRLVKVRPTTAVLRYAGPGHEPLAAGRELGVDALLDGYYQRYGEQLRVSVQIIRVRDGVTLWAAKFDESFTNFFAIQDSVSEHVVRELELELSGAERRHLRKNYTDSPEAFRAYIKGRYFWNRRTPEGLRKGLEYCQQAVALDPTYAAAYVGLADTYNLLGAQHSVMPPGEAFPKARAAAERALEIDPALAEAYASLAFVAYCFDWDWNAAESNFRKAVELRPNYATAHHWYGEFLSAAGRFAEAVAALRRALALDPLSLAVSTDLGATFYYARDYARAAEELRKALEVDAGFVRAHLILGAVHEQQGQHAEAAASLRTAAELSGRDPVVLSSLAHALAVAGQPRAARALLKELRQLAERRYVPPYGVALVHAGLGERAQVYRWLEEALTLRDINLLWLGVNPRFDRRRADAEFKELLRRVGLPSAKTNVQDVEASPS